MRTIIKNLLPFLFMGKILYAQSISYNQEFQVNTYTNSAQNAAEICNLLNGGYVFVWRSWGQDGMFDGIFGQLYDSNLTKNGSEFQVNTYSENSQRSPCISSLSNGGFVVSWDSYYLETGFEIYAQLFDSSGLKIGNEFHVNSFEEYNQTGAVVTSLKDDRFIICWSSSNGRGTDVYGQIFDNNGIKLDEEFRVNSYTATNQNPTSVTCLVDGGFVVIWTSFNGQDGDDRGVFGQIFNNDGSRRGVEFQVNTYSDDWQNYGDSSSLNDSGFVVCWMSAHQDGNGIGIFGQIFTKDGEKKGAEFQVNSYTKDNQRYPSVSTLTNGKIIVCWESWFQDGSALGIYGQFYDKNGLKDGKEFLITRDNQWSQGNPSASYSKDNGFIVCWASWEQDGDNDGVFAKYYIDKINHPLVPFSLKKPENDAIISTPIPVMSWQKPSSLRLNIPWELEYTLYLDDDEDFSSPDIIYPIYDTTYTVTETTPGFTYFWKVMAKNIVGDSIWCTNTFGFFVDPNATAIENIADTNPQGFKLQQNYPNPFNPETIINYELPARSAGGGITNFVKLTVLDITGREVATLVNEQQPAGKYSVTFNAKNLASGVYFYNIQAGKYTETRKMLLLR